MNEPTAKRTKAVRIGITGVETITVMNGVALDINISGIEDLAGTKPVPILVRISRINVFPISFIDVFGCTVTVHIGYPDS